MLRKDRDGRDDARDHARITHAYDPHRRQWIATAPVADDTAIDGQARGQADQLSPRPSAEDAAMDTPRSLVGCTWAIGAADGPEDHAQIHAPPVRDEGSDEDVFGHGGGLDQPAQPDVSTSLTLVMAASRDGGRRLPSRRRADLAPPRPASTRDHLTEAVRKLAKGSRPARNDGADRRAAVRRRVVEKSQRGDATPLLAAVAPSDVTSAKCSVGRGRPGSSSDFLPTPSAGGGQTPAAGSADDPKGTNVPPFRDRRALIAHLKAEGAGLATRAEPRAMGACGDGRAASGAHGLREPFSRSAHDLAAHDPRHRRQGSHRVEPRDAHKLDDGGQAGRCDVGGGHKRRRVESTRADPRSHRGHLHSRGSCPWGHGPRDNIVDSEATLDGPCCIESRWNDAIRAGKGDGIGGAHAPARRPPPRSPSPARRVAARRAGDLGDGAAPEPVQDADGDIDLRFNTDRDAGIARDYSGTAAAATAGDTAEGEGAFTTGPLSPALEVGIGDSGGSLAAAGSSPHPRTGTTEAGNGQRGHDLRGRPSDSGTHAFDAGDPCSRAFAGTARHLAPLCSAAAATGTAASDLGQARVLRRPGRNVRRRIVGKQRRPSQEADDAPPATDGDEQATIAQTLSARHASVATAAPTQRAHAELLADTPSARTPPAATTRSWDAAAGAPPDCGP